MLVLVSLLGCAEIVLSPDTLPCENWDLGVRDAPELSARQDGDDLVITRNGVFMPGDALFDPDFQNDRRVLRVFEAWTAGDEVDQCFMAEVRVSPGGRGEWDVQWYDDSSDTVPVDELRFKLD